jgi:hypothetical protein
VGVRAEYRAEPPREVMVIDDMTEPGPAGLDASAADALAVEIRRRRKLAGLSQGELAARVGYSRQYVSRAERPRNGLASAILVEAIDTVLHAGGALTGRGVRLA